MKTYTNKKELKELNACLSGYKKFIEYHGEGNAKFSECLDSNGWDDTWWLILSTYTQFNEQQKHDLHVYGCKKALINIEKMQPYCSCEDYSTITAYLNNPTESAESAAESAESARSAAWSAWSAWSAAESEAESAAWSAWSAARSAESAAMKEYEQELKELFIKWEQAND